MDSQSDTKINKDEIFYNKTPLLSYNGLFNFCVGARGTGKTFAFKKWALTADFQTVWIRRYQEDIDDLKSKFLGDMYAEGVLSPEDDITIEGDELKIGGITKIFFVPLSTSGKKKSQNYNGVNIMVFDELFEGASSRRGYLKNEVELLLELYETVNRLRVDGRPEVRVFLLSNKTTFVNPYFTYWNILPFEGRFKTFQDGLVVVENYQNKAFEKLKKQTKFGRLIEGTKYGDYAIDNKAWFDDNALLIAKKPKGARILCNIRYGEIIIGMWEWNGNLYFMKQHNPQRATYTTTYEAKDDEYPLMNSRQPLTMMKDAYQMGAMYFENNVIKQTIFTLLQTGGKL